MLQRDLAEAEEEYEKHRRYLEDYETSDDMDSNLRQQWMKQLAAWEKDHSQPNPFEKTFTSKFIFWPMFLAC